VRCSRSNRTLELSSSCSWGRFNWTVSAETYTNHIWSNIPRFELWHYVTLKYLKILVYCPWYTDKFVLFLGGNMYKILGWKLIREGRNGVL
jgi:hypothetical protein